MKRRNIILSIGVALILLSIIFNSCKTAAKITAKSGAQIWGETCIRCHNPASPQVFSDTEWEVTGIHMQIRGNLSPEETKKVVEFLQSAN